MSPGCTPLTLTNRREAHFRAGESRDPERYHIDVVLAGRICNEEQVTASVSQPTISRQQMVRPTLSLDPVRAVSFAGCSRFASARMMGVVNRLVKYGLRLHTVGYVMAKVDPDRFGGLRWVHRTNGRLSWSERTRLLVAIATSLLPAAIGKARSVTGWLPKYAREVDARDFAPPTSRLAREAEDACALLPGGLALHSYRTWMLGLALAAAEGNSIMNQDLFFCAALLHDFGLVQPTWGVDFTLAGANRAMDCVTRAGLPDALAQAVGDGICAHPTVGISVERDGPIGYYVQWGAIADIAGLRLWDITRANQDEVYRRYPRERSFGKTCAALIEAEAAAVRQGRFAFYSHLGMPTLVRLAARRPR